MERFGKSLTIFPIRFQCHKLYKSHHVSGARSTLLLNGGVLPFARNDIQAPP